MKYILIKNEEKKLRCKFLSETFLNTNVIHVTFRYI